MMNGAGTDQPEPPEEEESSPARALTLHLLRMLETRMDAAGIALQSEVQSFSARLQLRVIAAGALFIAVWGGIVLLAIALPPDLRIPVLAGVVAAFAIGAVWAQLAARRAVSSTDIGSMTWFFEGLRLDMEVLARTLAKTRAQHSPPPDDRSHADDLAA